MPSFRRGGVNTHKGTKARLWPVFAEGYGRGKITSLEVASIAFVWSAATPLPDFRMNSGQKPGPTLSTIWRKRHEKRC